MPINVAQKKLDIFTLNIQGNIFDIAISNILPCIFNVKISNFFWATLIGILPQLFLICSIGSGLEKIIEENVEAPKIKDIITSSEIYIPLIVFSCLVLATIFLRKLFYKK